MASLNAIIGENREYWTGRAKSYADVNREELSTDQRIKWQNCLEEKIRAHFPEKRPEEISVLEVGTGPGFFAILLARAGYAVTAIDLTPAMLDEARKNAGEMSGRIRFMEMNAEALSFENGTFDVVLSRNLTWNLPHPEEAYKEWSRVLKKGGLILNFDANWYAYLFDEKAKEGYEKDRENTALQGMRDENIGENFDICENIARRVPLSRIRRPAWDLTCLNRLGLHAEADEEVWKTVWSSEEKVNFSSTPMFLVKAEKIAVR